MISRTAATTSRGGASKLVRPAVKVHAGAAARTSTASATRHASTASHPPVSAWRAAVETIYAGTFHAIRSGATPVRAKPPFTGSRFAARATPRTQPPPKSSFRSSGARPHYGPRPGTLVPSTHSTGLGPARQFSSSGFAVFDNVVANVPLALRALADQGLDGGLDQRKWKRVRRGVQKKERETRAPLAGKALVVDAAEKRADFERFFGNVVADSDVVAEQAQAAAAAAAAAEPVTLFLALDPDFELPTRSVPFGVACDEEGASPPSPDRILDQHTLASFEAITDAYTTHSHRLRALVNRLSSAGLLDPEIRAATSIEIFQDNPDHAGRSVWKISFQDGLVTRSRVEDVLCGGVGLETARSERGEDVPSWAHKVRSWTGRNSLAAGQGAWWWIGGGFAEPDSDAVADQIESFATPVSSSISLEADSTPSVSVSSRASLDDEGVAHEIAATFVLPDPPAFAFDLDLDLVAPSPPTPSSVTDGDVDLESYEAWSEEFAPSLAASLEARAVTEPEPVNVWSDLAATPSESEHDTEDLIAFDEDRIGLERFLEEVEGLQARRSLSV